MKNQYTIDISDSMNPQLSDDYRYDQMVMNMNAQVMEEFIPKAIYQIQWLYRNGIFKDNMLDFRWCADEDRFYIEEISEREFKAFIHVGQQSHFEFTFRNNCFREDDSDDYHHYDVIIKDLDSQTPKVHFTFEFESKDGKLTENEINWYSKPHSQGDPAHLMRRFIRMTEGLEWFLTKEMENGDGEWIDIEDNPYTPLSTLRDKTIKLHLAQNRFKIDKKLIRDGAIDKLMNNG